MTVTLRNRRFCPCFDYVYKDSWKTYIYTTHSTVVVFMASEIMSLNGIFRIFL